MVRIIAFWFPVIGCMGWIFYTSSIPGTDIPPLFPYQDIVYHGITFLILAYFFARALKNTYSKISARQLVIVTFLFGMMYGISDELHQVFTPNRTASGFDVFIDSIGTFIGGLIWRLRI